MFLNASNFVEKIDTAFYIILGISFLFLIGLTLLILYVLYRYSAKRNKKASQFDGSFKLELIWTIIPTILVMLMFVYGYMGIDDLYDAPDNSMNVKVLARKWEWEFKYPNGKSSKNLLVLPLNKPVKLKLVCEDVNHSLFIPAFRVKEDVIPGIDNKMWFIPQKTGDYDILCAEYCGLRHSAMLGIVRVVSPDKYETWVADKSVDKLLMHIGYETMKKKGCLACHSTDGTKLVGPSIKGLWGKTEVVLTNGKERKITIDYEYVKASLYEPNRDVVKGMPKGLMPDYKGKINDKELQDMVDFMKKLQ